MKISCAACGKKYDPLRKDGICPYCGMHPAEAQDNRRVQERKLSPLRQKKIQIPLCLLLTAGIIGAFLWGNHRYSDRLEYYLTQRGTAQMHTEEHRAGDSVVLVSGGSDSVSSNIRVTGCKVRDEFQSKIEGEFKVIEVDYEDSGTPVAARLSGAYLLTENGTTVTCLDKFDIMELTGMTSSEFRKSEYEESVWSSKGRGDNLHRLLFAAPKAETEHTVLLFGQTEANADGKSIVMRYDFKLGEEDAL